MRGGRGTARARSALSAGLCLAFVGGTLTCGGAEAGVDRHAAYRGAAFGRGTTYLTPTAAKPQNKLWWYDGRWWTLQVSAADRSLRVASLQPDHRWALTPAVVSRDPVSVGDVVADGSEVHVLTRTSAGLVLRVLTFDPDRSGYRVAGRREVAVAPRGSNAAALAMDSRGRLWATYVRSGRVWVAHSAASGRGWVPPYPIPGDRLGDGEIAEIVAFDGRVGVLWSDQVRQELRLAVHRDGRPDREWATEVVLRGSGMVDDHLNALALERPGPTGKGTLLVAVKTGRDDRGGRSGDPLVLVLRRTSAGGRGSWSQHVVATVGDRWTRPVLTADVTGTVYVVARRAGRIVLKSARVTDLAFRPGAGTTVMGGPAASLTDPSVPSRTVDTVCGVVVLASDPAARRYWHAELALAGPTPTGGERCARRAGTVPVPADVAATAHAGRVRVSWADSGGGQWSPALPAPAGRRYVVERDGSRVGATSATTFVDRPRRAGRHVYRVVAVDEGIGRSQASAPVGVQVRLAGRGGLGPLSRSAAGDLVLVLELLLGAAVVLALGRYAALRWPAAGAPHEPATVLPSVPQPQGRHVRPERAPRTRRPGSVPRHVAPPRSPGRHRRAVADDGPHHLA